MTGDTDIAIIGGGPAGLMAAQVCAESGARVSVYEAMPSFGRKFLMAGKSGLNITHIEDRTQFLARYRDTDPRLITAIEQFDAQAIRAWMQSLGIPEHIGSTGRVFPEMMKASPLLRAWLARLRGQGVNLFARHRWTGWTDTGALRFTTPNGEIEINPVSTVLALGGGSWRRLGSDGSWREILQAKGVETQPFAARNCGFEVAWSQRLRTHWAGAPVKSIGLSLDDAPMRGEFVITERGIEGGAVYMLSARLQRLLAEGRPATISLDLFPDMSVEALANRLSRPRGKTSLSNFLRKTVRLGGVKLALMYETVSPAERASPPHRLAAHLKAIPLEVLAPMPLDEAISSAGGVAWQALDASFALTALPDVFCAGEMIAWDAPTGGYLLSACLATGRSAGAGALASLRR